MFYYIHNKFIESCVTFFYKFTLLYSLLQNTSSLLIGTKRLFASWCYPI